MFARGGAELRAISAEIHEAERDHHLDGLVDNARLFLSFYLGPRRR